MLDGYKVKANVGELKATIVRIAGNATVANASIVDGTGDGVTLGYSGTGIYTLTFAESPGAFVGMDVAFQASTPGNVAGHTAIADDFASNALPISVFNAADTAHALVANEYLLVTIWTRSSSV